MTAYIFDHRWISICEKKLSDSDLIFSFSSDARQYFSSAQIARLLALQAVVRMLPIIFLIILPPCLFSQNPAEDPPPPLFRIEKSSLKDLIGCPLVMRSKTL